MAYGDGAAPFGRNWGTNALKPATGHTASILRLHTEGLTPQGGGRLPAVFEKGSRSRHTWGDSTDLFRPQGRLTTPTTAREAQEYAA